MPCMAVVVLVRYLPCVVHQVRALNWPVNRVNGYGGVRCSQCTYKFLYIVLKWLVQSLQGLVTIHTGT